MNIAEPIIKGIEFRPLNTYRLSTISQFINSEYSQGKDQTLTLITAYCALATNENEKVLHRNMESLADACIDIGLEFTDEELSLVGEYIVALIDLKEKNKVQILEQEKGKL